MLQNDHKNRMKKLVSVILLFALVFNGAKADITYPQNVNMTTSELSDSAAIDTIQALQKMNPEDILQTQSKPESVNLKLPPVKSERLSVGVIHPKKINLPSIQPIFIIGSDQASLQWLSEHLSPFKALHAIGLLVNEESDDDLDHIRKIAEGVPIIPIDGDDIAKELQLQHYPAFISSNEITQ